MIKFNYNLFKAWLHLQCSIDEDLYYNFDIYLKEIILRKSLPAKLSIVIAPQDYDLQIFWHFFNAKVYVN